MGQCSGEDAATCVVNPPRTEAELLSKARSLAGLSLGDIARQLGQPVPPDLRHHKGFVGHLLERALGASAGSRPHPDFEQLGVELKSLPVTLAGKPLESTFVCTIDLNTIGRLEWRQSRVFKKLARVLWVPIQGDRSVAPASRRVGSAFVWSLGGDEEAELRNDWEELASLIGRGRVELVTAHIGKSLQVRPKARDSRARRRIHDDDGLSVETLPRGFYLRASFTRGLLAKQFGWDDA